jgi:hypothetical protein
VKIDAAMARGRRRDRAKVNEAVRRLVELGLKAKK